MNRAQTFLLGSAFWVGGLAVFGGFAYAMNRPLTIPAPPEGAPVELTAARVQVEPAIEHLNVVTIPEIEIVGHAPAVLYFAPEVIVPASPPAPRNLEQMNCSDWRPLEQGGMGSSVRECQ